MPRFDLSPAELADYAPDVREPADFDAFWADTLAQSRQWDASPDVVRLETPYTLVDIFDVTFPGFGGDPVKAWLTLPAGADGPLPAVVEYQGYGGGRGLAGERLGWAAALARAAHGDAAGVDLRERAHGVDGAHRIREDPAVVVGLGILDAAGHETR